MRVGLAIAALALFGCAGETYYRMPEGAEVARVRFTSATADTPFLVTQHASPACDFGASGGIMGVVGGISRNAPIPISKAPAHVDVNGNTERMIGYPETAGSGPIERVVAADRDFVFTIYRAIDQRRASGFLTKRFCTMTLQVTPRPGEQYEMVYSESGDPDKESFKCTVTSNRLQASGDGSVRRIAGPAVRRMPQTCSPGAVK